MIVTTATNAMPVLIDKAQSIASKLDIEYYSRQGKSLKYLLENIEQQIFVVNNMRGLSYYELGKDEAFFHPNMAFHRIANLKKGYQDSMVVACKLQLGMSFFDGTLGLAADSLVASYTVGERGEVASVEKSLPIYILVKEGLEFYGKQYPEWSPIIERISIQNRDNLDFMRKCMKGSFDIVYFDFMFSKPIINSDGIQVIRNLASRDMITAEHIYEALRVSKSRVVVKSDSNGIKKLLKFGFIVEKENRKRNFHYAVLEK